MISMESRIKRGVIKQLAFVLHAPESWSNYSFQPFSTFFDHFKPFSTKKVETAEKSSSTSFRVRAAPESWSKYTKQGV